MGGLAYQRLSSQCSRSLHRPSIQLKIVSRPEKTLTIQFREFERPKKGGQMQLKESKTITLYDVSLKQIDDKLLGVLKKAEEER